MLTFNKSYLSCIQSSYPAYPICCSVLTTPADVIAMRDQNLPDDVLQQVLDELREDFAVLYRCSIVNWQFNRLASKLLYESVEYSPPFQPTLDLRDRGDIPVGPVIIRSIRLLPYYSYDRE